jgi:hypothetical protein
MACSRTTYYKHKVVEQMHENLPNTTECKNNLHTQMGTKLADMQQQKKKAAAKESISEEG